MRIEIIDECMKIIPLETVEELSNYNCRKKYSPENTNAFDTAM